MRVKLSKVLGFILGVICIWVIAHLWSERKCSDRYFSDQKTVTRYYDEAIWKLKNIARESSSIVLLLYSQQIHIELLSQQLRRQQHPNSSQAPDQTQDCHNCQQAPLQQHSPDLNYAPFLFPSQVGLPPLRRVGLGLSGYRLVLGIPTVDRGESYLLRTLKSLLSPEELPRERKALFIVFVAELSNSTYCQSIIDQVQLQHSTELKEGVLEVVCPNPKSYPPLGHLPQTLSDPPDRVMWRSKQVVDFSLLMWYAAQKGDYYIQLEDDILASRGYIQHILSYVDSRNDNWVFIHFSTIGFIGKLFKKSDLTALIEYFLLFYFRQPVDWLLVSFMRDLVCYYTSNDQHCDLAIDAVSPIFSPSLFQHIGTKSSLKGKTQDLVDTFYNKGISYIASDNPPAHLSSSLHMHQSHIPSMAYTGQGVMWATDVQKDEFLLISFFQPQPLVSIHVVTGGNLGADDLLTSGQVEFSTNTNSSRDTDFTLLCPFKNGKVDCDFPSSTDISMVRIYVTQAQTQWLLISDLKIKPLIQNT